MRRHAKASTAGSTQRRAGRLGRFFRGAFVTRGASLDAKGSGAPSFGGSVLFGALLLALVSPVFGVAAASAAAPAISTTTVSAVTTKAAVLEADVNPEGEATTYHFEHGLADCSSNLCTSVPIPSAGIGAGISIVRVSREVKALIPDTTYHFRVVATNGSGTVEGPDRTFKTYAVSTGSSCPNDAFRFGFGSRLPDCRAYEMVSPVDKSGGDIWTLCNLNCFRSSLNQASVDGGKMTYSSYRAFAGAQSGQYSSQYMATRGPDGWATQAISPPQGTTIFDPFFDSYYQLDVHFKAFSPDLSSAWLFDENLDPLTSDAVAGDLNAFRRDNSDGSYHALTTTAPTAGSLKGNLGGTEIVGVTPDGDHVLLRAKAALTPNANLGEDIQLYDFTEGAFHLVSVLPDGTPNPTAALAGGQISRGGASHGAATLSNAISEDGSRIFWTTPESSDFGGPGEIYVRIDGETTIPVSESPAFFWTASTDGSKALFARGEFVEQSAAELYEFNVDAETETLIAGEAKGVLGASDDLSHIYFVSKEDLDSGATAGELNLYLDREGAVTFIATLAGIGPAGSYPNVVNPRPMERPSRVTPDGRHIAFMSTNSLTGYDNTDAVNGKADLEVFTYDADADELTCVSCNPSGARPVGHALNRPYAAVDEPTEKWAAAWLSSSENSLYEPHALSEDGNRLFFNSFDGLLPEDTNGTQDVYQWQAQGSDGCTEEGGCLGLISTGQSPAISEFVDATPNGSDVFFTTNSSILPQDPDLIDIYDARVNGGYPPPPPPPTPCFGDACQDVPPPPNDATPASASFRGAGDPAPKKARRNCRARGRKAAKKGSRKPKKAAKACKRAKRRAAR